MSARPANFYGLHIRKWYEIVEETLALETGLLADGATLIKLVIGATIVNPHAGKFTKTLDDVIVSSRTLGQEFGRRIRGRLGGLSVESYGKAALVGSSGEYEHGNAFLTTAFAEPVREAIGGAKAWIPSTGKRAAMGASVDIPLAHKDALYVRSHYDTVTVTFTDSPAPDEIVVAVAVATRGRLHARLGGPSTADIIGTDGLR
jgi:hypothetical protein